MTTTSAAATTQPPGHDQPRRPLGWLPPWLRTIRSRLALTYSAVVFGLAAVVVVGVYAVLSSYLDAEPLDPVEMPSSAYKDDVGVWHVDPGGATFEAADIASVERAANHKTLRMLRELSLQGLGVLFLGSVATGWWLAGRALRPVRHISRTAEEITASDLSRRIGLDGPDDELRQLADTLDGMLDRLHEAFEVQREMIGDASHELRNPLAIIRANVDAILAHDDVSPQERSASATVVVRATGRMTRLVEELLASARRHSPAFEETTVDLATLVTEVTDEHRVLADQHDLRLRTDIAPQARVSGDPRSLARAIGNLLSNALRLAPSGSTVWVSAGTSDGRAWIRVTDEGPGIAADEQDRIFNRFYRGANPGSGSAPTNGNSGLGLAIVRQIVEAHDGSVAVDSTLGTGSTFTLWLPTATS